MTKTQVVNRRLGPVARPLELLRRMIARLKDKEEMQFALGSKKEKDKKGKIAERQIQKTCDGRDDYALKVRGREEKTLKKTAERLRRLYERFIGAQVPRMPQLEPIRP